MATMTSMSTSGFGSFLGGIQQSQFNNPFLLTQVQQDWRGMGSTNTATSPFIGWPPNHVEFTHDEKEVPVVLIKEVLGSIDEKMSKQEAVRRAAEIASKS